MAHLPLPIASLSVRAWRTCRAVSFLRAAALLRLLASLVLRHLPPKPLLLPPLRLAALAALLVGLGLPKLLEPVQRSLEPLRRMLVLPLPVLLRLPVSLMQARLLPGQLLWIFYLLCSSIMAALSRALIERVAGRWMAGRWIWTPCSIHPLPIKRFRLWIKAIPILVASFLPV